MQYKMKNPDNIPIYGSTDELNKNLPNTVELIRTPEGENVYLVGTAHYSIKSQDDVSLIIRNTEPAAVVLELCPLRLHIIQYDEETLLREAKDLSPEKIRQIMQEQGVTNGFFYLSFLRTNANITRQLGIAPGGECRRAVAEANKIDNCKVLLGDRPINITLQRALSGVTFKQKILMAMAMNSSRENGKITIEDVEKYKERDRQPLQKMKESMPSVYQAFVVERDIVLAHSMYSAAKFARQTASTSAAINVVGIIGMGHMSGIIENFGKTNSKQVAELMKMPSNRNAFNPKDPSTTASILHYMKSFNWSMLKKLIFRK